jgi:NADH:ubiquinone oxidoreductase subunit 5 (subunit L)/multisubunit Na+/H+ antiporter MnhA subunit
LHFQSLKEAKVSAKRASLVVLVVSAVALLAGMGLIYRQMGVKSLEGIENVGPRLAEVVEDLLSEAPISDGWCTPWKYM